MFKWIKRKWKDRRKLPVVTSRMEKTRSELLGMFETDHVYEEIADPLFPTNGDLKNSLGSSKHRPHGSVKLQRSISYHDILKIDANNAAKNYSRNMRYNSTDRLPTIMCSSLTSLATTPASSSSNLHTRDVTFQLLPENDVNNQLQRDPNFRVMPLHSNVYLPRKSATFASADSEMCRKRVQFQNAKQHNDSEIIYAAAGSDSGYGFSNNNSTGSDESDTTPRGNYDAYVSKMDELLRLEKEVRNILKTIRGEDEPDDGYQNSRYFQEDPRFADVEQASRQTATTNTPEKKSSKATSPPARPCRHDSNAPHVPLMRIGNISMTPESNRRTTKTSLSSRVHSPLPPTPTESVGRSNSQLYRHPAFDIPAIPTTDRNRKVAELYLTPTINQKMTSSSGVSANRTTTSSERCNTPFSNGLYTREANRACGTPLSSRKIKQTAPRIQDKSHLPMSLHTKSSLTNSHTMSVPKDAVCIECSKRGGFSPRMRQRALVTASQSNLDYCNNNNITPRDQLLNRHCSSEQHRTPENIIMPLL